MPATAATAATFPTWNFSAFVIFSAALHLAGAVVVVGLPESMPWVLGLLVLDHAACTAAGLVPRSRLLGANITRLPAASAARGEIALTFDDGPDPEVTPALLDLLDAHDVRASFFCIAERVQAHPALARDILARGHSIENHTARHRHDFALLGPAACARELDRAQALIASATGQQPTCFRAPAGLRNLFLAPALARRGLRLVSWTRRGFDTRTRDPACVMARLAHRLTAGDILLLHDGNAARTATGHPVLLEVLPALLQAVRACGLRCVSLPSALRPDGSA